MISRILAGAIFRNFFHAFFVSVVLAILALYPLLEKTFEQLFAIPANGRPRVGMQSERVRNFYSISNFPFDPNGSTSQARRAALFRSGRRKEAGFV